MTYLFLPGIPEASGFPDEIDCHGLRRRAGTRVVEGVPGTRVAREGLHSVPVGDGVHRVVFPGFISVGGVRSAVEPGAEVYEAVSEAGVAARNPAHEQRVVAPVSGRFGCDGELIEEVDVTGQVRRVARRACSLWVGSDDSRLFEVTVPEESRVWPVPGAACEAGEIVASWWRPDHDEPDSRPLPGIREILESHRGESQPGPRSADYLGRLVKLLGDHGHRLESGR